MPARSLYKSWIRRWTGGEESPVWTVGGETAEAIFDEDYGQERRALLARRMDVTPVASAVFLVVQAAVVAAWFFAGAWLDSPWWVRLLSLPFWLLTLPLADDCVELLFFSVRLFGTGLPKGIAAMQRCARRSRSLQFSQHAVAWLGTRATLLLIAAGAAWIWAPVALRELILMVTVFLVAWGHNALGVAMPPFVLLLAASNAPAVRLNVLLNAVFVGCRTVSLFHPDEEDLAGRQRSWSRSNSYRTQDGEEWRAMVQELAGVAYVIVLDCTRDSAGLRIEREMVGDKNLARKTLVKVSADAPRGIRQFVREHHLARVTTEDALLTALARLRARPVWRSRERHIAQVLDTLRRA